VWVFVKPLLIFFGCLLAVTVVFYAVLHVVSKAVGGSVAGGAARMAQFAAWAVTVVQLIAQVGRAATPGLPSFVRTAYAAVNIFQFDGVAVPAGCTPLYPFTSQAVIMSVVLVALVVVATLHFPVNVVSNWTKGRKHRDSISDIRPTRSRLWRISNTATLKLLLLLYPIATNAVFGLVNCTDVDMSVRTYFTLNQDASRAVGMHPTDQIKVSVLVSNPYYVCYEASHATVGYLSWLVIAAYVIAYPLGSLVWAMFSVSHVMGISNSATAWRSARGQVSRRAIVDAEHMVAADPGLRPFTASDYRPSCYWFVHLDMFALLILSAILVFWSQPSGSMSITGKATSSVACALLIFAALWMWRPYSVGSTWKQLVRSLALILTALAAVTNGIATFASLSDDVRLSTATVVLSAAVTVVCLLLLLTLIIAFGRETIVGARKEQEAHEVELKRALSKRASSLLLMADRPSVVRRSTAATNATLALATPRASGVAGSRKHTDTGRPKLQLLDPGKERHSATTSSSMQSIGRASMTSPVTTSGRAALSRMSQVKTIYNPLALKGSQAAIYSSSGASTQNVASPSAGKRVAVMNPHTIPSASGAHRQSTPIGRLSTAVSTSASGQRHLRTPGPLVDSKTFPASASRAHGANMGSEDPGFIPDLSWLNNPMNEAALTAKPQVSNGPFNSVRSAARAGPKRSVFVYSPTHELHTYQ
jgi:hypothetical protein